MNDFIDFRSCPTHGSIVTWKQGQEWWCILCEHKNNKSLQSRLAEKEAECAVMRASLKKYGRHDPECEKACPTDCDCGYNKIISSASASRIEAVERAGKILEEPNKNHWAIAQPQLLEVLENALTELRKLTGK